MTDEFPTWKPDDVTTDDLNLDAPEVDWAELDPTDLDRLFDVLDAAVDESRGLDGEAFDRLLSVLEATLLAPTTLDDEEFDDLLDILEDAVVDPANPEHADEVLKILEASVAEADGASAVDTENIFSLLRAALVDPREASNPVGDFIEMVDDFGRQLTETDGDVVESTTESVLSLFDVTGYGSTNGDIDEAARNFEDLMDSLGVSVDVTGASDGEEVNSFLEAVDMELQHDRASEGMRDEFRVARIAAAATQRSTEYSIRSGVRVSTSMIRAVTTAESLADLIDRSRDVAFGELDRLGVDVDHRDDGESLAGDASPSSEPVTPERLRERGARLLDASADVEHDQAYHPAFPRILDSLCPDEARILRLFAIEGPQPAVDVKDVGLVPITAKMVATGLTMIGPEAGCRYESRVQAYLNNLHRLGLIWFSDEPVDDLKKYQVVEAQPAVVEAAESARRAKVVRRSVHLTPFGVDFCRVCLPVEVEADDVARTYQVPDDDPDAADDVPEFDDVDHRNGESAGSEDESGGEEERGVGSDRYGWDRPDRSDDGT